MPGERTRTNLGWAGLLIVLAGAFGRAVCGAEPFPYWESDPFRFAPPIVGLTPVWALSLNIAIMLGAALVVGCVRPGIGRAAAVLLAIGMGVLVWHSATDLETVPAGADLAAGMASLVAAWAGSALPGARRVMVGVALGFGVLLAVVGAQQMYVEHPRTVESFEQTGRAFYEARGWDPDGPEAAMYEERLSHAEPTGWFGLTNVLATFTGAAAVGLIGLAFSTKASRVTRLVMIAGGAAAAWTLITTVSKGAIGAAALAALVVAVTRARVPAWTGRVVLLAALGVVLAVAARGVVGERLGERSLLFRSQYMQGTGAVWAERPIAGIGPGQFQDAYTRLKPARAPEEVTSPHSVGFDWIGLLGLGGVAWVGLVVIGLGRPGEVGSMDGEAEPGPDARTLVRLAAGVVGVAVILAALIGRAAVSPGTAGALLAGGLGWAVVAGLVCLMPTGIRAAALGAGAVAVVHGQLDVTPVWTVSAPAWGVLVGMGIGALGFAVGGGGQAARRPWGGAVGAGVLSVVAMVLVGRLPVMARWERGLIDAAAWPRLIALARVDLSVAEGGADPARMQAVAERVGGWLGGRVPAEAGTVGAAINEAALRAQESALPGLESATEARPGHVGTRTAWTRVLVTIAMRDRVSHPERAAGVFARAVEVAEEGARERPQDPGAWSWLGAVLEQGAALDPARSGAWLARAGEAWMKGDPLTPHAPASAARIAEALARAGRADEAGAWATRALGRDDALDMDPRRRLSAARRAGLEAIARGEAAGVGRGVPGADPP